MEQLMVIFQLRSVKGSFYLMAIIHCILHSPLCFGVSFVEIQSNFVLCFATIPPPFHTPMQHVSASVLATVAYLHLVILHLGLDSSPSHIYSYHTSNPAADNMWITISPLANATRAHHLDSHNSIVTQDAHPTLLPPCSFAIHTCPTLLLSLTFADCITSC